MHVPTALAVAFPLLTVVKATPASTSSAILSFTSSSSAWPSLATPSSTSSSSISLSSVISSSFSSSSAWSSSAIPSSRFVWSSSAPATSTGQWKRYGLAQPSHPNEPPAWLAAVTAVMPPPKRDMRIARARPARRATQATAPDDNGIIERLDDGTGQHDHFVDVSIPNGRFDVPGTSQQMRDQYRNKFIMESHMHDEKKEALYEALKQNGPIEKRRVYEEVNAESQEEAAKVGPPPVNVIAPNGPMPMPVAPVPAPIFHDESSVEIIGFEHVADIVRQSRHKHHEEPNAGSIFKAIDVFSVGKDEDSPASPGSPIEAREIRHKPTDFEKLFHKEIAQCCIKGMTKDQCIDAVVQFSNNEPQGAIVITAAPDRRNVAKELDQVVDDSPRVLKEVLANCLEDQGLVKEECETMIVEYMSGQGFDFDPSEIVPAATSEVTGDGSQVQPREASPDQNRSELVPNCPECLARQHQAAESITNKIGLTSAEGSSSHVASKEPRHLPRDPSEEADAMVCGPIVCLSERDSSAVKGEGTLDVARSINKQEPESQSAGAGNPEFEKRTVSIIDNATIIKKQTMAMPTTMATRFHKKQARSTTLADNAVAIDRRAPAPFQHGADAKDQSLTVELPLRHKTLELYFTQTHLAYPQATQKLASVLTKANGDRLRQTPAPTQQ